MAHPQSHGICSEKLIAKPPGPNIIHYVGCPSVYFLWTWIFHPQLFSDRGEVGIEWSF